MQYQNAIENPVYFPAVRDIAAITNAANAVVTTTFAHGYVNGTIIRFFIPQNFGMTLLNGVQTPLVVTSDTEFTVPIDTTYFDPFVVPPLQPGFNYTAAQVTPIGEVNETLKASFVNILRPI